MICGETRKAGKRKKKCKKTKRAREKKMAEDLRNDLKRSERKEGVELCTTND